MKLKYLVIIGIIGVISEILLSHSSYISEWQLVITFAWSINYYSNPQVSFLYILPASFILELFTFKYIGSISLLFCVVLLILSILKNYLNVLSEEQKFRINIIGLCLNLLLLWLLTFILYDRLLILKIIIGTVLSFVQFFLFTKGIKIKTSKIYET